MTTVLITLLAVVLVLAATVVVELVRVSRPRNDRPAGPGLVDANRPTILLFLTTTCATCGDLWSADAASHRALPGDARLLVVTRGAEAEDRARVRRLAARGVRVVMSTDAWRRYGISVAPYAVRLDTAGAVAAAGSVSGWGDVLQMCPAGADVS